MQTPITDISQKIPDIIRDQYEELSCDLQNTYLKWMMNRQLFGGGSELLNFLDDRAPSFFVAVQDSFITDLVVSVSRFTDRTPGTLSLGSIIKQLRKSCNSGLASELEELDKEIIEASKDVKTLRGDTVAHKGLSKLGKPLPNVSWSDVDAILEKLARALNLIARHFLNSEIGYKDCITHGDAAEVVRLMRRGVAHEEAEIQQALMSPT